MRFRYNIFQKVAKKLYRKFFPVPTSPWTMGEVKDICAVNLVPPEVLKTFFTSCVVKLQALKGDEIGDYLEFGVFNGSSISSMMHVKNNQLCSSMRLFGFDAFEGLPEGAEHEDDGVWKKGFYACSFEDMCACLKRKNINPDDITWVRGWYEHTLHQDTIKQNRLDNIGIVFIDCDTYSSSKAVLEFIGPLLTRPAILCFDDWKLNDLDIKGMGEYRAFNEFIKLNPHFHIKSIKSYNRKSRSFLIQPSKGLK